MLRNISLGFKSQILKTKSVYTIHLLSNLLILATNGICTGGLDTVKVNKVYPVELVVTFKVKH